MTSNESDEDSRPESVGETPGGAKVEFVVRETGDRDSFPTAAEAVTVFARSALESNDRASALSSRLPAVLADVADGMELRTFEAGEIIIREGDPGNAIYLIVSGDARVLKADRTNRALDLIEVARLGPGEIFGEFAVLADFRRHATVQAVGPCSIYTLDQKKIHELVAAYPALGSTLQTTYRRRLLSSLPAISAFFDHLPPSVTGELVSQFHTRRYNDEGIILAEGDIPCALTILLLGSAEVVRPGSARETRVLSMLGEGDVVGAQALLTNAPARSTVRARGPLEVAELPLSHFYSVVADNPTLWLMLRDA